MPELKGLVAGERLTDGERRYYRLVLEPAPVFGFFDRDFAYGVRQLHEGISGGNLVIPTHAPAVLTDIDAYVLDVVTLPRASTATVADLVEQVERFNLTTRLRSVERVGPSQAGASTAGATDRARTENAVVKQKQQEGAITAVTSTITSGLRTALFAIIAVSVLYLWLAYGGRR